jgi:Rrf2 family protein
MVSQTAEYALRAIVYLAGQAGEPRTTAQIAAATFVPAGYLAKVMQSLSRARVVNSQRGLYGGFTLASPPEELTIHEVVSAVDPIRRYPECPLGLASHGKRLCPLHRRLDEAAQLVEDAFRQTKVSELLADTSSRRQLCRFPASTPSIS